MLKGQMLLVHLDDTTIKKEVNQRLFGWVEAADK